MTTTVGAAIEEATDESLGTADVGEDAEVSADETTEAGGESEETTEEGGEGAEGEGEAEDEGEAEVEEEPEADGDFDIFDTLTPEQQQAINQNPELKQLRKALLRGYEAKTTELKQLVQLGDAWRQNPRKVVEALAQTLNLSVSDARAMAQAAAAQTAPQADPLEAAGKELEALFGTELGPRVRAVFDKWADARIGKTVGSTFDPIRNTLGQVVAANEQNRMLSEEATFKSRHKELTPAIEKRIVDLGNSGKYIPGRGQTPQDYLDALHDIATAQIEREKARRATGTASKKLAARVAANRRDREPSGVSGRGGSVKPVSKIANAKSISEALDIAAAELEAGI